MTDEMMELQLLLQAQWQFDRRSTSLTAEPITSRLQLGRHLASQRSGGFSVAIPQNKPGRRDQNSE